MPYDYLNDPTVRMYYEKWIKLPTFFTGHPSDEERFYKFVKACVRYARTTDEDIIKVLDTQLLRSNMKASMREQVEINEFSYLKEIDRFVVRFSDIVWYEATQLE
ncbi:MAG: hypothetical protein Q7T57_01800 [Dehalococcoidales bacterium]|nr:hypothetical protein [Dehalococcoidales bacterium]